MSAKVNTADIITLSRIKLLRRSHGVKKAAKRQYGDRYCSESC